MSNTGWFTMKDVLTDLEEVTGKRIDHFDNRFAVSGERPPPVNVSDEEDDFLLMYKGCISKDTVRAEPDLAGIKHMLRMVNDNFDDSAHDDKDNIKELKENANAVVSITKLNPNVPDFVPRGDASISNAIQGNTAQIGSTSSAISTDADQNLKSNHETTEQSKKSLIKESLVCKDNFKRNKIDASQEINVSHEANNNIDIGVNKRLDSEEIKNLREQLKLKITNTSNSVCLKKKKEKNLAIVSLLKLYTEVPTNSTGSKSVALMTPDYFKTAPEGNLKANSKSDTQHYGQNDENNEEIISNSKFIKRKVMKSLNDIDNVPYLSQEAQKSDLRSTSSTTQSQDDKCEFFNSVSCKRKGTTSVPHNNYFLETPVNVLTSDSDKDHTMIINDTEQRKCEEIYLTNNLTNKEKMGQEVDYVPYLLLETSHQSQQSNLNPTTHLQDIKTDFTNDIYCDRVLKQDNIDQPMSKEVKESIKKVNKWLKVKPEQHTSKSLWLGPVTYKRKENTSVPQSFNISESPLSGSFPESLDISEKSSRHTPNSFVPTSYADELTKKYMERSKQKESRSEDIWTKLERELKEKDKLIKEKMNEEIQRGS